MPGNSTGQVALPSLHIPLDQASGGVEGEDSLHGYHFCHWEGGALQGVPGLVNWIWLREVPYSKEILKEKFL